jgi:hypothetical protein
MKVRTTGTKRARMIARAPKRSKNSAVCAMRLGVRIFEFGRSKIAGPALRPI